MVTILTDSDEPDRPNTGTSPFSESPRPPKRRRRNRPVFSQTTTEGPSQAEEGDDDESPGEDSVGDNDDIDICLEDDSPEEESEEESGEDSEGDVENDFLDDSEEELGDQLPTLKSHKRTIKKEPAKPTAKTLKIYHPKYYTDQEPTFVTQLTQPSSSPSRIRGPRWKKPQRPTAPPRIPTPDLLTVKGSLLPGIESPKEATSYDGNITRRNGNLGKVKDDHKPEISHGEPTKEVKGQGDHAFVQTRSIEEEDSQYGTDFFLAESDLAEKADSPYKVQSFQAELKGKAEDQHESEDSDEEMKAAILESLKCLPEKHPALMKNGANFNLDTPQSSPSPLRAANSAPDLAALGLDFDPDDIPDVFNSSSYSSPSQASASGQALSLAQQGLQPSPWRSSNTQQQSFRQTTLFGGIANIQSPSQSFSRAWPLASQNETPTHHMLNPNTLSTWTFPMNIGTKRDYQYNISQRALFHNILVALPTGLGKTFIAATVMLNWYRWTQDAQIVFIAPTKPLVSQQIDACFNIVGIPRSETTMLTGDVVAGLRAKEWETKRVFFMTPQTLINDLKSGIADPKRIVLLVVDEAHRATGAYVYVEVVKLIRRVNTSFRILALTATPGSSVETVQEVIDGLNISRVEIRTEESLDIRKYVHAKNVDTVSFSNSDDMKYCMEHFTKALKPVVKKLNSLNAYWGDDPMSLTPFGLTEARKKWMMSPAGKNSDWGLKGMINSIFAVLASLAHAIELLKYHGVGPFYRNLVSFRDDSADGSSAKKGKYARQILDHASFKLMMTTLRRKMLDEDFIGHPKLEYLKQVILNHFLDADANSGGDTPSKTRVMVFSHFRDSAEEIVRVLKIHDPIVLPHVFVGQASSKSSEGMDQKRQLEVIKKFKEGIYNTIVATSIGEEGLDIGEVDLIICYDSSASPTRMLQRMGRTGRKRMGKVVLLLMEGKEEEKYVKAKDSYEKMQQMIASGSRFTFHEDQSPRIIPREIQPRPDERRIEIPIENSQAELPVPKKRGRVPKKPPKKFHMPDGVETGFTNASSLTDATKRSQKIKDSPKRRKSSPKLTDIMSVDKKALRLTESESLELRRNFQTVAGTTPQFVTIPKVDAHPFLQRFPRPIGDIPHAKVTLRVVKALRRISELGPDCDESHKAHIPSDIDAWEPHEAIPSPVSDVDEYHTTVGASNAAHTDTSLNEPLGHQYTSPNPQFVSLMCTQTSGSVNLNNDSGLPIRSSPDEDFPDIDQLVAESFGGNNPPAHGNASEPETTPRGFGKTSDSNLEHYHTDDGDPFSDF